MKKFFISRTVLLIVILFSYAASVFGNGGGVYATSATVRSSDPILREIKDITLLSEKLIISLNSRYSEVVVKYVLWNGSDRDYTDIDYAFPIDYIVDEKVPPEIKRIAFFYNDQQLDFTQSQDKELDKAVIKALSNPIFGTSFLEEKGVRRRWYYTKFSVKKHSFACLEVRYSLANLGLCDGISPYNIDYFDLCSRKSLVYDLSPASSWGDGVIRDFHVEISWNDLLLAGDDLIIDMYSQFNTGQCDVQAKGLAFERHDDKLVYHTRNFDLKKAVPLLIEYSATSVNSMETLFRHMIAPQEYSLSVSDEQSRYPQANLSDLNLETAWVGKTGSYIEFSFRDTWSLYGFLIVNGYQKSAETYGNNNRVKRLKIESVNEEGKYYVLDTLLLEDLPYYQPIFFENLFYRASYYDLFDRNQSDRNKLRLTIEEVYSGTKYDDTCISEIIWLGSKQRKEIISN